jgi:hypothetical protein
MRQQRRHVRGDPELRRAYREGVRHCKREWGDLLADQATQALRDRRNRDVLRQVAVLLRHRPRGLGRLLRARRWRFG